MTDGVVHSTNDCSTFSVLGAGVDLKSSGPTQVPVKKEEEPGPALRSGRAASAAAGLRGKAGNRCPGVGDGGGTER